jgi:hypothetical protein
MFRSLMREHRPDRWKRLDDYDLSFERLADTVDAAAEAQRGKRWSGPDLRMRCTTTEAASAWPRGAPHGGGTTVTWETSRATAPTPPLTPGAGPRRRAASAGRRKRAAS